MKQEDLEALLNLFKVELVRMKPDDKFAIVGATACAVDLLQFAIQAGFRDRFAGIFSADCVTDNSTSAPLHKAIDDLRDIAPAVVIIASDEDKEALLDLAVPHLSARTRVLIGGFGHFQFREPVYLEEAAKALIPSFANGYPNSLIHIYQCLANAARLNLEGIVAEFGMFKGGTTMLMSRFIERLGKPWRVVGFDTYEGFPPRRSPLDMYAHPDCVCLDEIGVRRNFEGRNVEIIVGDIVETVNRIGNEDIVLAFVDTDNYTPAVAVLDVIQDRVVPGGAIVFDHFTGRNRFLFTLGERIAAKRLLADRRYFNLHDTGVFFRQR
ncbi:MAG: class I SAM-dependent methyltransferase [Rhizomicrobium sp.]